METSKFESLKFTNQQQNEFAQMLDWLFDGRKKGSPGFLSVPGDVLKSKKINNLYLIKLFLKRADVNYLLNEWFNYSFSLFSLDREELLLFLKDLVQKFKVSRRDITYYHLSKQTLLASKISSRFPELRLYECQLLARMIENDELLLETVLGDETQKKETKKRNKQKRSSLVSSDSSSLSSSPESTRSSNKAALTESNIACKNPQQNSTSTKTKEISLRLFIEQNFTIQRIS